MRTPGGERKGMIAAYVRAAAVCARAARVWSGGNRPGGNRESGIGSRDSVRPSDSRFPTPESRASDSRPAIVFLGTSLTAGYGLADPSLAYPALIQARLDSAGRRFRVVNAGISGESSAGALSRVESLLSHDTVAVLVVETGANEGPRGADPDAGRGWPGSSRTTVSIRPRRRRRSSRRMCGRCWSG